MTTLERAKQFCERIDSWPTPPYKTVPDRPDPLDDIETWRRYLRSRVARALIRQEVAKRMEDYPIDHSFSRIWGIREGLEQALDILDAVYGREKKS